MNHEGSAIFSSQDGMAVMKAHDRHGRRPWRRRRGDYIHGKNLGAAPPQKKKDVPHRKVTTRNLFKVPHGYPNGVAIAPEGLWVGEQKAQGYGKEAAMSPRMPGCSTGMARC